MSNVMNWWRGTPTQKNRASFIGRTQPPSDGSRDKGGVYYLRRSPRSEWRTVNPVLADREVVYETDTDTFVVGDGKTPYTGLPLYVRRPAEGDLSWLA